MTPFCVLVLLLSLFGKVATAACVLERADEKVVGAVAVDGDTLKLADGRRLRLVGVNTPELSHGGRPEEPLAAAATSFTRQFLARSPLSLQYGSELKDHYGRWLVYVFDANGASLQEALVRNGLAAQIAYGRDDRQVNCLAQAEADARQKQLGVWGQGIYQPIPVSNLAPGDGGFHLLRGRVVKVTLSTRGSWWVDFEGDASIQIGKAEQSLFSRQQLKSLIGKEIEVRGWLIDRQRGSESTGSTRQRRFKRWMLPLKHPAMIRVLAGG